MLQSGIVRLELHVEPGNEGSLRAAAAAGYRQAELLSAHREIDGRRRDVLLLVRTAARTGTATPVAGPAWS